MADRQVAARRRSVAAVNWRLFERARPERLNLSFGCEPVLELVTRFEAASFGVVVRRFSGHSAPQIQAAPDGGSLLDRPYRAVVNRARRPSAFAPCRLPQHLSWSRAHDQTSSRTLACNDLACWHRMKRSAQIPNSLSEDHQNSIQHCSDQACTYFQVGATYSHVSTALGPPYKYGLGIGVRVPSIEFRRKGYA